MSDLIEEYEAMREYSRKKKLANKEFSTLLLDKLGIDYTSHNNGIHLKVMNNTETIDFYPSTGTFLISGKQKQRGVVKMLKYMGVK